MSISQQTNKNTTAQQENKFYRRIMQWHARRHTYRLRRRLTVSANDISQVQRIDRLRLLRFRSRIGCSPENDYIHIVRRCRWLSHDTH